jgi:hypothetical protein
VRAGCQELGGQQMAQVGSGVVQRRGARNRGGEEVKGRQAVRLASLLGRLRCGRWRLLLGSGRRRSVVEERAGRGREREEESGL